MKVIRFTLNGNEVETAIDERESLADTLRALGMKSVKKGCEVGECGACTVLLDGKGVDSCIYLTIWAEGKSILTVEKMVFVNLGEDGLPAPHGRTEIKYVKDQFQEDGIRE